MFHIKPPSSISEPIDNHYGLQSRLIVNIDDELEASGSNLLDESDIRTMFFQPRYRWQSETDDSSKSKLVLLPIQQRRILHRGENAA